MAFPEGSINLRRAESNAIAKLSVFPPGTTKRPFTVEGNSVLSTIYVQSLDPGATVKLNYYQVSTGVDGTERIELTGHSVISSVDIDPEFGFSEQRTITRIHTTLYAELVVTGGSAQLGILVSVVDSFATDLESALKFDGHVANFLSDKGMPIMGYDSVTGLLNFLRLRNGLIGVTTDVGEPWREVASAAVSTDGEIVDVVTFTVGLGKSRTVSLARISTFADGIARLFFDTALVGSGRVMTAHPNESIRMTPGQVASEGTVVKLTFESCENHFSPVGVDGAIYGSELE